MSLGLKLLRSAGTMAALIAAVSALMAAPAGAATTPADPTVEFSHTFTTTGGPQELRAPAGVEGMTTRAVGGRGAGNGTKAGGLAAEVQGVVPTEPGQAVWVLVGGNANGTEGGYNGGAGLSFNGYALGGGGGGATDIRKIYPGDSGSLESRLIVAGGGGGAGGFGNGSGVKLNAAGGNAGGAGARAESAGPDNTVGSGGYGGAAGGPSAGGNGGEGGFPYSSGCGARGGNGVTGAQGVGGVGGAGPTNAPTGWGGGGGGGLYGGGGGGAGGEITCTSEVVVLSGGGGGGGSSLAPTGGSIAEDRDASSNPELSVHYSIPGTVLSGPSGYINSTEPTFAVSSEASDVEFECRLVPAPGPAPTVEPAFEPCGAEPTLGPLAQGIYAFEARATNSEGNFDPTPAALEFQVLTSPPVIVEVSGPTATTETRPTFTFVGGSIAPITFECAFDGAAPGPCSGADSDQPAEPLGLGEHTFSVTPTDAAGNVGATTTRAFTVVSPPETTPINPTTPTSGTSTNPTTSSAPPPVASEPRVEVGGWKANGDGGSGSVDITVNGPGHLSVSGAGVKSTSVTAAGPGSVRLPIKLSAAARKKLEKVGKLAVRIKVSFTAADGMTVTKTVTVQLKEKRPAKHRRPAR